MAVTVAQLRKFLEQFPDDTVVEVLAGRRGSYESDFFRVDLDLTEKFRNDWNVSGDMFEYYACAPVTNPEYTGSTAGTLFLGED